MGSLETSGISKFSMSAKCRCIAVARPIVEGWRESGVRTLERIAAISASIVRPF